MTLCSSACFCFHLISFFIFRNNDNIGPSVEKELVGLLPALLNSKTLTHQNIIYILSFSQTSYKPEYSDSLIQHLCIVNYDVNYPVASSGMTLFLVIFLNHLKFLTIYFLTAVFTAEC